MECSDSLNRYRTSGDIQHWKEFKTNVRLAKRIFFDEKIQEIAMSNKRPWDLMNWVKKKSLPAVEAISYEGHPCNSLSDLWQALHRSYNPAEDRPINERFLNEISQSDTIEWPPFSQQELRDAIAKCSSHSAPGPDHISWRHLKFIISNDNCIKKILQIANTCFDIGYWPSHFKAANSIIIPKPNKESYNSPKSFHPIVLLNTVGKLIEKTISNHLQFHMTANGFCHKLHSAISPSILHRFSRSQWLRKALEKTFRSVPVTSRGDQ